MSAITTYQSQGSWKIDLPNDHSLVKSVQGIPGPVTVCCDHPFDLGNEKVSARVASAIRGAISYLEATKQLNDRCRTETNMSREQAVDMVTAYKKGISAAVRIYDQYGISVDFKTT